MSAEEALFRAQATTSVYDNEASDPVERHLLTLSESRAEYAALPPPPTPPAPGTLAAPTSDANAPEIVVQVRKRKGGVELLLDGYVSTGVPSKVHDNTRVHKLTWHRGLHEDAETDTRVFSPLAFVAAVEDGQHPLQAVKVGVVQAYENDGVPVGDAVLLAEAALVPHRVSDVRCNVLRTPFPLSYPPQLKVTIADTLRRRAVDEAKFMESYQKALTAGATTTGTILVKATSTTVASAAGVGAVAFGVAGVSTLALAYGWPFVSRWMRVVANRMPQIVNPTAADADKERSKAFKQATSEYLKAKPAPDDRTVTLTLNEFSKTLETMSLLKSADDEVTNPFVGTDDSADHRKAHVLWAWLQDPKYPEIDLKGMTLRQLFTVAVHVRVSVDDPMACSPSTMHHELRCDREDRHALAAAASGAIQAIYRARRAVLALSETLDAGLNDEQTGVNTWYDRRVIGPAYFLAQAEKEKLKAGINELNFQGLLNGTAKFAAKLQIASLEINDKKQRKTAFLAIRKGLQAKLIDPFFKAGGPVDAVLRQMEAALRDTRMPTPPPAATWTRRLPQRVRALNSARLFTSGTTLSTEYADTQTEGVFVREHSKYESAMKAFSESTRQGAIALARFVPQWEASLDTCIALTCRCTTVNPTATSKFTAPHCYSTLVLSTPADIQFAATIASIPEHTRRRLRLVAKRAQSRSDKSVLEALGLRHANADLLACQIFGDLWISELLAMHAAGGGSRQVQMLERASSRAAARLRAAGEHLLQLVGGANAPEVEGASDDLAPSRTDTALVATQAGRDAGLLLDRVLFRKDYRHVRAAMAPFIRNCAYTAVRAAAAFEQSPPTRLPHAPTASLFGHPHDGASAFLRARAMETNDVTLAPTMAAAYPSARLLAAGQTFSEDELNARAPERKTLALPRKQLVAAMRFRLASLQLEPNPDEAENLGVDELAEALATVKLEGQHRSFYVPFGFGDARPAPTLPPCAAPMFGTVPVFGADLVDAFADLARCLRAQPSGVAPKQPLCVRLQPILDCLADPSGNEEIEGVHPNMIHLSRDAKGCVIATYAASRAPPEADEVDLPPLEDDQGNPPAPRPLTSDAITRAAEAHVCDGESADAASRVSSLAWNAERVVQAVVASLASAELGQEFDAVTLTLELPADSDERSHWYSAPRNPFAATQKRNVYHREANARLDEVQLLTLQHVGLLEALYVEKRGESYGYAFDHERARAATVTWLDYSKAREDETRSLTVGLTTDDDQTQILLEERLTSFDKDELKASLDRIETAQEVLKTYLRDNDTVVSTDTRIKDAKALFGVADAAAIADGPASNAASRRALVGALGVGAAMLRPLLAELPLTCEAVTPPSGAAPDDAERFAGDCDRAARAFANCAAVRLSEACLLVGSHVQR